MTIQQPRMLNELIEKIEVHQSEKIDGKTVQRLTIHYTCVGVIDIPDLDKIRLYNKCWGKQKRAY